MSQDTEKKPYHGPTLLDRGRIETHTLQAVGSNDELVDPLMKTNGTQI